MTTIVEFNKVKKVSKHYLSESLHLADYLSKSVHAGTNLFTFKTHIDHSRHLIQLYRQDSNGQFIDKYGGQGKYFKVSIQVDNGQPCVRAWYNNGPNAHNSPISAIIPVLNRDKKTVILQALDVAHAKEGIFKRFFIKFEDTEDAKNFISVYLYLAPSSAQENSSENEGECDRSLSKPIGVTKNAEEEAKGSDGEKKFDEAKGQIGRKIEDQYSVDTKIDNPGAAVKGANGGGSDTEESTKLRDIFDTVFGKDANEDVKAEKFSTHSDDANSSDESEPEIFFQRHEVGQDGESDCEEYAYANTQQDNWAGSPLFRR